MIEISRDEFLQKLAQNDFPSKEWVAVSLFVLQENWNEIRKSDPKMFRIIECGKQVLLSLSHEGLFALIGWAAYFACINCTKATVLRELDNAIDEMSRIDQNCKFWMHGVAELADTPSKVYYDLEWKSFEAARESLGLKLVSKTHSIFIA